MSPAIRQPDPISLDLSYRPDLGLLAVRRLRDVSFEELQAGFRAAGALGHTHGAASWLMDVQGRFLPGASQSEWVAQQRRLQVAPRLRPLPLRVAPTLPLLATPAPAGHGHGHGQNYALPTFSQRQQPAATAPAAP